MMTSVYNDADYLAVYKQKQKILHIFLAVTLVYLTFCIAWLIYYISLPYNDPMQTLPKACVYVVSAVYVVFLYPFMGIKFSRLRRYFKVLTGFSEGRKNEEKNYFYCFEEHNLQKDNVDVTYCIFETWNKKKQEWMEREAYFDMEKPLPQLGSGDYVQYIVQSNFIVQYRILEKGVYEFEEVSDEDEYEDYDESAYEEDAEDGVLDVETDENAETAEGVVSDEEI
ncbi:MAG: hypothetical protein IJX87_02860 [Clostridia bacterium]|nr:hypothetical protein [Clostridia bacterium]